MTEKVIPFYCGTQYLDWTMCNCESHCSKAKYNEYDVIDSETCDILKAINAAYFDDGAIDAEIAKRMGYDSRRHNWPCPEHDPPWEE